MLPQIAGRFSQCSDSLLNTQSEQHIPTLMLLLVIIPIIELVQHAMCRSLHVHVLLITYGSQIPAESHHRGTESL